MQPATSSRMKTNKKTAVTFSDGSVNFTLPSSWADLDQKQLRYVFFCLGNYSATTAKLYILCRFTGMLIVRRTANGILCSTGSEQQPSFMLMSWQLVEILKSMDWMLQPNYYPVRLDEIDNLQAVERCLHGVEFRTYLQLENLYQGFLRTHQMKLLAKMTSFLYRNRDHSTSAPDYHNFKPWLLQSVFLWYQSVKNYFSMIFPDFFSRVDTSSEDIEETDMMKVMNAEIRALTGGDICKEEQVLSSDCWRALTELNEKAREAREWKEKYGRH